MFFPKLAACLTMTALYGAGVEAQSTSCAVDSTAPWALINRSWASEAGRTWSNDSLRRVLLDIQREDQDARREFGTRLNDSAFVRQVRESDQRRAAVVNQLLDRFGLPTRSMVGPAGASALFLVVQHSEVLQRRVLELARQAPAGEVPPSSLAMLEDRVLTSEGKPQRHGTQFTIGPDGVVQFETVEDPAGLARRRTDAGLPPLDLYICFIEEGGMKVDRRTLPPWRIAATVHDSILVLKLPVTRSRL